MSKNQEKVVVLSQNNDSVHIVTKVFSNYGASL